ncbi:MAG: hypothetical protein RL722_665 [Pseudomonadota bacterium]|jgi:hypothetical protein
MEWPTAMETFWRPWNKGVRRCLALRNIAISADAPGLHGNMSLIFLT